MPKAFLEGIIHLLQGNKEKAQPALEHAAYRRNNCCATRLKTPQDMRSMDLSLRHWIENRRRSPKANARSNCYPNLRTPLMDRKLPLAGTNLCLHWRI